MQQRLEETETLENQIKKMTETADNDETIKILDDIAVLEPVKNVQIAAKK